MNYITIKDAAQKWNITERTVQGYCKNEKIPGAKCIGKQWVLPIDASRPEDGRTKTAKKSFDYDTYHFPLLVFSECFTDRVGLSDDELSLLEAQFLNLRCEFTESVCYCRKLISETNSPSVRFGAWFTNAFNYMLLGLASEIPTCINAMESICKNTSVHQEDYRLLIAYVMYVQQFNPALFWNIDVSKLSPGALITYRLLSINISLLSGEAIPEISVRIFQTICQETDLLGVAPASLSLHASLALLYSVRGDKDAALCHIEEVCRIGFEYHLDRLLAKFVAMNMDSYVLCLRKYGDAYASKIESKCHEQRRNWKISFTFSSNPKPASDASILEHEIVLLLTHKMAMRDIAILKNISEKKVRKIIQDLCVRMSVGSKKELVELFKHTYASPDGLPPTNTPPIPGK